jgi:chemotaxis protein histidine kinase CheA
MRRICVLLLGLLTGCASLQAGSGPDPEERLARGLSALEQQDYRAAYDDLTWVYSHHWNEPLGRRALLALVAAELDPRNRSRRLGVGAELAAAHLRLVEAPQWTEPVAETLYLLALELGAAEERLARAEADKAMAEAQAIQAEQQEQKAREGEREAEAKAQRAETKAEQARKEAKQAEVEAAQAKRQARQARAEADRAERPLPRLPGPTVPARVGELRAERDRLSEQVRSLKRELSEREQELERIRKTLQDKPSTR